MHDEKDHIADTRNDAQATATFDEALELSADAPLDPKSLPALGAVYLLSDADERPIFLSVCENLRRVVPPRLAMSDPDELSKRAKLGEIARRISWKRTRGAFEGLLWHWQFARRLFPDRYNAMLGFGPCWFVRVDPDAAFPRFESVGVLREDHAQYFGPIPRRKDADSLIRTLEDSFDLCRYYEVLLKTPNGERCAYYDMGRCPAPCDGTAPMDDYRRSVREAIAFLDARDETTLEPIRRRMRIAAESLAFESAAAYKRALEDAQSLRSRGAFARIVNVSSSNWIVILRAGVKRTKTGETQLKAYCISKGRFQVLSGGPARNIEALSDSWRENAQGFFQGAIHADARSQTESMRLLSRFLFKDEQRDALIYELNQMPPSDVVQWNLGLLLDRKRRY